MYYLCIILSRGIGMIIREKYLKEIRPFYESDLIKIITKRDLTQDSRQEYIIMPKTGNDFAYGNKDYIEKERPSNGVNYIYYRA